MRVNDDPMRDESYHPEWTLSPTHHAVLKDMRKAGERRRLREQAEEQAKQSN
jgi:hypothetical protein